MEGASGGQVPASLVEAPLEREEDRAAREDGSLDVSVVLCVLENLAGPLDREPGRGIAVNECQAQPHK